MVTVQGTKVKFPVSTLKQISENGDNFYIPMLTMILNDVTSEYPDSLSEAIDFGVKNRDGNKFKDNLDTPITVGFFVDKNKVKNWADLTLVYVDEEGNKKYYPNQVKSINPETSEVVVGINHFSTYYIAEVVGQGAGEDKVLKPGQSGSSEPTVKATANAGDVDSQTLPNTATNTYNLLLAGAFILALGLGAVVLYRRKKSLN